MSGLKSTDRAFLIGFFSITVYFLNLSVMPSLECLVYGRVVSSLFKIPQGDFSNPRNPNVTSDLPKISGGTQF